MRRYKPSYFINQAFKGIFRNGMMTAASVVVLFACLTVLGAFTMLVANINYNLSQLDNLNEIIAFCDTTVGYKDGENAVLAENLRTTDGRIALGWTTEIGSNTVLYKGGDTIQIYSSDTFGGTITLYPVFDDEESYEDFLIRYNAGGIKINGQLPSDEKLYINGEIINLPTISAKNSSISFLGWSLSPNAVEAELNAGESFAISSSKSNSGIITLYAVWSEKPIFSEYSLVYDCGRYEPISTTNDYDVRLNITKNLIKSIPNIEEDGIKFISREETLKSEMEGLSEYAGLKEFFEDADNPYPDTFVITCSDSTQISEIENKLNGIPDIYKVRCRSDIAESINSLKNGVSSVFLWFSIILFAVSVLVIVNTVKLAVEYRSKEIVIMKYIGATRIFVALPFELEGIIIGVFSGLISFIIQWIAYGYVSKILASDLQMISIVPFGSIWQTLLPQCLIIGAITGFIGSLIAIWKYLKA